MKMSNEQDAAIIRIRFQIASRHGLTVDEMIGRSKMHALVRARREFAIEAKKFGFTMKEIGRYLGGRDHTTVMHLIRTKDRKLTFPD